MRILQARFTGAHTSGREAFEARTVVTIDDDSDDGDTTETEASVPKQEDVRDIGDTHEDFDQSNYNNRDKDAFVHSGDYPEEQGDSDILSGSTGSSVRHISVELIADITEGSHLAIAIVDPAQSAQEIGHVTQNMEIVHVVPSFSNTLNTLAKAALAESSPTTTSKNPRDKTSTFQITSPLPPIFQHFPAALQSKTFAFHWTLPTPSHIQPLLQASELSSLASLSAISFGDIAAAKNAQVNDTAAGNVFAEHPSSMSWLEWENSFTGFKAFFDGGVQVLRSVDELLPLCDRFNGYATFQGALVYPEMVAALEKFMDKYEDFMDMTGITSSFSQCAAFWTLGLVLHGMDTMHLLNITDHRLLFWRDAICEAMTLGFWVEFLLNLVKDLARVVFEARAIHNMESFFGPDEIKVAAEALNLKLISIGNCVPFFLPRVFLSTMSTVWRKQ
ncbi:unnamed protein product [Prunus armeniaca]